MLNQFDERMYIKRWCNYKNENKTNGKLFVDSGAFGAWSRGIKLNIDDYISYLNENRNNIDICASLDVIPGNKNSNRILTNKDIHNSAQESWKNYLYMRERVINKDSLLYTYHINEPIEYLKQALDYVDNNGNKLKYIGLGGMVGKTKEERRSFLENVFLTIDKSNNKNIKTHAFGMTDFDLIKEFPISSADSTSWIMIGAMGKIITPWGIISLSDENKSNKNYWKYLSDNQIQDFKIFIEKYGYNLTDLSKDSALRRSFNCTYMMDIINEINISRKLKFKYIKRKKLF